MRKQHPSLLLHPFFIACVLLLLLNDFVLKAALNNWLTGKLSDVTGLAAFALFFTSIMPRHKGRMYIITALLFMWWKSPLAQPFIQLCHTVHIPVTRVVDYSDYFALLVLPAAWLCKPVIINNLHKKLATYSAGAVSVFAFCATTMPYRFLATSPTGIEGRRSITTSLSMQQIEKRLDSMGIQYTIDSFNVYPEKSFDQVYFRDYFKSMQFVYKHYDSTTNTTVTTNLPALTKENLYRRYATWPYILIHNLAVDGEIIPAVKLTTRYATTGNHNLWVDEIELSQAAYERFINREHKTRKYYQDKIYTALLSKLQQ